MKAGEKNPELGYFLTENISFFARPPRHGIQPWTENIELVYAITLPERQDNVARLLTSIGAESVANVFRALPKRALDLGSLKRRGIVTSEWAEDKNRGRIACHLSHLAVLYDFVHSGAKSALVLEDDVAPPREEGIRERANRTVAGAEAKDKDWDMVYLGYCYENRHPQLLRYAGEGEIIRLKRPRCRHAYVVSQRGARKLLEMAESEPVQEAGDVLWERAIIAGKIKAYGTSNPFLYQNRNKHHSTLGNKELMELPPYAAQILPRYESPSSSRTRPLAVGAATGTVLLGLGLIGYVINARPVMRMTGL